MERFTVVFLVISNAAVGDCSSDAPRPGSLGEDATVDPVESRQPQWISGPEMELGSAPEEPKGFINLPTRKRGRRTPSFNVGNRAEVYAAYQRSQAEIMSITSPSWTGSVTGCNAGDINARWRAATISRLNLYREMCGLDNVTEDSTMSADNQQGSLIISSTGILTHTPASSSLCYSQIGYDSNSQSNIAIGSYGPVSVDGYIDDRGANNAPVGHRRWKLYPQLAFVGSGDTGTVPWQGTAGDYGAYGNNIMVLGRNRANGVTSHGSGRTSPNFVAWPPGGYCPYSLLPSSARWSFSKQGVDFSSATVTINGASAPVTSRPGSRNSAMPTVVFTGPTPSSWTGSDASYSVQVTVEGTQYNYVVNVFDGLTPNTPTCDTATVSFSCMTGTYSLEPTLINGRVHYSSSTSCNGQSPMYIFWSGSRWYIHYDTSRNAGFASASIDVARPQDIPANTWATVSGGQFVVNPSFSMTFSGCGSATATTTAPSRSPTRAPSRSPTRAPSRSPTRAPSRSPTRAPIMSAAPSRSPTRVPTRRPTQAPTRTPTRRPTRSPTTQQPSSYSPTSVSPTSLAPTSTTPTSLAPTSIANVPTSLSPTTRAPVTVAPTTQSPTTRSPSATPPTSQPTLFRNGNPTESPAAPTVFAGSVSSAAPTGAGDAEQATDNSGNDDSAVVVSIVVVLIVLSIIIALLVLRRHNTKRSRPAASLSPNFIGGRTVDSKAYATAASTPAQRPETAIASESGSVQSPLLPLCPTSSNSSRSPTKTDALGATHVALYEFAARNEDEVDLTTGSTVSVDAAAVCPDGFVVVVNHEGRRGMVPAAYLEATSTSTSGDNAPPISKDDDSSIELVKPAVRMSACRKHYRALYDFPARNNSELGVHEGDVLIGDPNVPCDEGFIYAMCGGRVGVVPVNYLTLMDDVPSTTVRETESALESPPSSAGVHQVKQKPMPPSKPALKPMAPRKPPGKPLPPSKPVSKPVPPKKPEQKPLPPNKTEFHSIASTKPVVKPGVNLRVQPTMRVPPKIEAPPQYSPKMARAAPPSRPPPKRAPPPRKPTPATRPQAKMPPARQPPTHI